MKPAPSLRKSALALAALLAAAIGTALFFRARKTPAEPAFRVLCVGDSVTRSGGGQSYPAQLERVLRESRGAPDVAVINEGVGGGVASRIVAEDLEEQLDRVRPHVLVVLTNSPSTEPSAPRPEPDWLERSRAFADLARRRAGLEARLAGEALAAPGDVRGYLLESRGKRDVEAWLRQGLARFPRDARIYLALARAMVLWGKPEKAEPFLRQAEALPQTAGVHEFWGHYFEVRRRWAECVVSRENALVLSPLDPAYLLELGTAYQKAGNPARGIALLEEGVRLHPSNDRVVGTLATLYLRAGRFREAEALYARADELRLAGPSEEVRRVYDRIVAAARGRKTKLVVVQYPLRALAPLEALVGADRADAFVDNERSFKEEAARRGYDALFIDQAGGDTGHCTPLGNKLLAENVARAVGPLLPGP